MDGEAAAGSPLEVVSSSQHGLKRCHRGASEGSDDDDGAAGAARGAPRRAGIDAVEEEEEEQGTEAFVEEGVHAETLDVGALIGAYFGPMEPEEANADADADAAQQLFDFLHFLQEVDGDDDEGGDVDLSLALGQRGWSTTGAPEIDTTLRLGLGGEQPNARDESVGAWLGAALQDGVDVVGVYLPPGSDDYVYTGPYHILPPPPVPEDSADFIAFFEADAAPADDAAAAPAAPWLDLNQPHAAPAAAAHEELFLFASNDDRLPEPCFFWSPFLAGVAGDSHVPDMAPADDSRAAANTNERPTVSLELQQSSAGTYTAETSENRRGVTAPAFAFSGEFF